MTNTFNPYDEDMSWFFGELTREQSTEILMKENDTGTFLIRNSKSIPGDVVLCVKEDCKVSHYIINKTVNNNETRYRIGDQKFTDIPSLLNFYRHHYLDKTPLIKPAKKKIQKVRAKYDFKGGDTEDLPFNKGDKLIVLSKNEELWWFAKNEKNQRGLVPTNYVELIDERTESQSRSNSICASQPETQQEKYGAPSYRERELPAKAKVIKARVPNAYDHTALKLQVGDIITVTKLSMNGQWEGELNNKVGHFPFTHIEFIDSENTDTNQSVNLAERETILI